MDVGRMASMLVTILFALFRGFQLLIAESAEFANVQYVALSSDLIDHTHRPREAWSAGEDRFYIGYFSVGLLNQIVQELSCSDKSPRHLNL